MANGCWGAGSPREGDLEGGVSGDEGGESGEGLLPGAPHSHQQRVPLRHPNHARYLHQVRHRVLNIAAHHRLYYFASTKIEHH